MREIKIVAEVKETEDLNDGKEYMRGENRRIKENKDFSQAIKRVGRITGESVYE